MPDGCHAHILACPCAAEGGVGILATKTDNRLHLDILAERTVLVHSTTYNERLLKVRQCEVSCHMER